MKVRRGYAAWLLLIPAFVAILAAAAQQSGSLRPGVFAVRDARVITEPGKVLAKANVVIRDGVIADVGVNAAIPPDALIIDGHGLSVYPGFVDALNHRGFDPALRRSEGGAPAPEDPASEALAATKPDNRKGVTPEFQIAAALRADGEADNWRHLGFTTALVGPEGGILAGQSAVISLSGEAPRQAVLRSPAFLHAALQPVGGGEYPRVLMGVVAHARQTLLDAGYYHRLTRAYEAAGRLGPRPLFDPALAALDEALDGRQTVVFEADTRDEIHRALDFAAEFKLRPIIYGGRNAWKCADRLKAEKVPVLLRLSFTEEPRKEEGESTPPAPPARPGFRRGEGKANPGPGRFRGGPRRAAEEADFVPERVRQQRQHDRAEEERNAAELHRHGIAFAISTAGISGNTPWTTFRDHLGKAIAAGLPADAALRALTTEAARLLGVDRQLGSIAPGKAANLIVMDGDFQDSATQIQTVFVDGVRFDYEAKPRARSETRKTETAKDSRPADKKGTESRRSEPKPQGNKVEVKAKPRSADKGPDARTSVPKPADKKSEAKKSEVKPPEAKKPASTVMAGQRTELDADRRPRLHTHGDVLFRGATILTAVNGNLPVTDLLVRKGKIAGLGKNLVAPPGVLVVDAAGMFIMPGIIDTHCHFAIAGGVNEFSLSVVPEVRVRDVIDSEDVEIFRALAGGVTTARLLHGSANCIGGQDAVIKLKYGQPASRLLIAEAPRGVKFALGENVKRTDGRFPNTRLGVEAVLIRAFTEAEAYRKTWDGYQKARRAGSGGPRLVEPRRDLRLEALADILRGDLKVHCHCYRADEILMLLRVADRFGFAIKSLQHVLEGYKIAAEIADHGASCSSFADWWAYKIEAYDAIPFNAALLHEAGVSICLKSDSNELTRHLYQEAAKCIKYGGMSEQEALKTVTLNGAKQLGLEKRLGSIEIGKDADLAIFNGHPLNSYARVEMTVIDGEIYFQHSERLQPTSFASAAPTAPQIAWKLPSVNGNGSGKYAILGTIVHPGNGAPFPAPAVVVENGRIIGIYKHPGTSFPNMTSLDAHGLHLFPGMIDAGTVLGLTELGSARETHDYSEAGDFQPDLRASTAINPDSELIPVTRANGVTTVVTQPVGSILAGQSALINLSGWVPREMAVVDPLALHVEFPAGLPLLSGDPNSFVVGRAMAKKQRDEKVKRLKELFAQALAYQAARATNPAYPGNPRLEAIVPYASGQKPVVIQANRRAEILDALKLIDGLKLKAILSGGIEAWKVAGELKKRKVPVIFGPVMSMPQEKYDPYDAPYAGPARLHEAGVAFCIRSGGSTNTRNLPYEAAMAASYGLPPDEALRAVTLYPAQILGVADQFGTIEVGKRANLVLANGDLLQAATQVQAVFIDGKPLEPTSKHTRLYERYRERLRDVRAGRAPLGTK